MKEEKKKCGFVTLIGRPNVGKSTLLNKILGQKIVIATDKAQTTRRQIKGIFTDKIRGQIVFIDTPGCHKPLDKLGEFLNNQLESSLNSIDLVVFVCDVSKKAGKGDRFIVKKYLTNCKEIILVLNKVDLIVDERKYKENIESYKQIFEKEIDSIEISAKRDVSRLVDLVFSKLKYGEYIYPEDQITDESMRNIAREIVREKILNNTRDEIPHSVATVIDRYEERESIDRIYVTIYVDQKSQKGILIGENGQMLKRIGTQARLDLQQITGKKVYLELNVKLEKDWKRNKNLIDEWLS